MRTPADTEFIATYFRVLANPNRLRILELLHAEGELSVGEVAARLGHRSTSSASRHLHELRHYRLIERRRKHRVVYYRIADERVAQMIELARQLLKADEKHAAVVRRRGESART